LYIYEPTLFVKDKGINNGKLYIHNTKSWFEANKLSLNIDKTTYITFTTKNSLQFDLVISYANKLIPKELDIKFLRIHLDSTLSWKIHIEKILPKLSAASCAM
jgi:hypothetical protein